MLSLGLNLGDKGSAVCIKHVVTTIGSVPKSLAELSGGNIPVNAVSAIISITAGSNSSKDVDLNYLATFTEDGLTLPAIYVGHPLGHQGVYQVIHEQNLKNFRIATTVSGINHHINISYYC